MNVSAAPSGNAFCNIRKVRWVATPKHISTLNKVCNMTREQEDFLCSQSKWPERRCKVLSLVSEPSVHFSLWLGEDVPQLSFSRDTGSWEQQMYTPLSWKHRNEALLHFMPPQTSDQMKRQTFYRQFSRWLTKGPVCERFFAVFCCYSSKTTDPFLYIGEHGIRTSLYPQLRDFCRT